MPCQNQHYINKFHNFLTENNMQVRTIESVSCEKAMFPKKGKKSQKKDLVRSERNLNKVWKIRKNCIFERSEKTGNPVWQLCKSKIENI